MNDAQRRYMHARQRMESALINPATELLEAAHAIVQNAEDRANRAEVRCSVLLEQRGFNEPDFSARIALSQLWEMLGAKDQTQACANLRALIEDGGD
ncbi:MAG: hypothetical protein E6R03_03220 [Hyphomicrobiaceae bacterium]|nr:MAG: hypothetical protein E6R03_03220 [Hyphomicrobiaceae bacterium]